MSGVLTGTPARTDAQWARDTSQQLTQVQQAQTARIGNWTLSDQGGDLVATKMGATPLSLTTNDGTAVAAAASTTTTVASADGTTTPVDTTFLGNLEQFFADLNFTSSSFNPAAAAELFVTQILNPTGLLADVSSLVSALTGSTGGLSSLTSWSNLIPLLSNTVSEGGQLLESIIPNINAGKLFGTIEADLFGVVPAGTLSTVAPEQLKNPTFTAGAIAPSNDWSVDMTTTRTADGSGAALVVADGKPHALRSGSDPTDKIAVGVGQKFPATINVSHTGATSGASGPPVVLGLQPFNGDAVLDQITLDSYSPATPDLAWPGHSMTGTYLVPDGVTHVQVRPALTDQALAGNFWFDDASAKQAADYTTLPGLLGALQTLDGKSNAIIDGIATVAKGIPVIGGDVSDMVEALKQFNPLNIFGSTGATTLPGDISGIIGHIIDVFKGQPAGTTTTGSLADLYNAVNAKINNNSGTDETNFYDTTTTGPINSWANQLDFIIVGAGQNGEDGITILIDGQGGNPGQVNMVTLLRGTHYDSGTPHWYMTVNTDGSIVIGVPAGTSTAAHSITAVKGSGTQSPHFGSGYMGIGPGPIAYNNKNYAGGGNQNTGSAPGIGPGGGGAGGVGPLLPKGGLGAPAGGWVRQLATAITGAATGADITAPSGGTGSVISTTNSSITVSVTGAVDA